MERSARLGCYRGFGNAHGGILLETKYTLDQVCSFGERDDQHICIDGVIERLARYYPEQAAAACTSQDDWKYDVCEAARIREMYDPNKPLDLYLR